MTAANTRRGKTTEQAIARWLRINGFPGAERTVRTGYRTAVREAEDAGDLNLCPGVIAQTKSLRPANRAEREVPLWMRETEAQRVAAGAEYALLIVRREGTADVGEWWAWLRLDALYQLASPQQMPAVGVYRPTTSVRLSVEVAVSLLISSGYGTDPRTVVTGWCDWCGTDRPLTDKGLLAAHDYDGATCVGWARKPIRSSTYTPLAETAVHLPDTTPGETA